MDSFLNWFFSLITKMFGAIWNGIVALLKGIIGIFDFKTYFGYLANYQDGFGALGWILTVLTLVLVYAFWAGLIYLLVLQIKKKIRDRRVIKQSSDLLDEIARLHRDMDKMIQEKERIMELKFGPGVDFSAMIAEAQDNEDNPLAEGEETVEGQSRFYRLTGIDEKYSTYKTPAYRNDVNLQELCDEIRNYACYSSHLYYEIKIIRLMMAGLASTKMVLLQGISGTGKTSLPYMMGKYFCNDACVASVQPSWRDRSELFGFFNEFTKKFNETEVLCRIYEANYNDDVNIIILDEMNIARVEYYFAEMLSILEMPVPEEWKIQLVPSVWDSDPVRLESGKLQIPQNLWYVGTANNDDSTFAVSDKVYDRAFVINLDTKGVPFDAPKTEARRISATYIMQMYKDAIAQDPVSDELLAKVARIDDYVIEHFRVAFGNRIMKQFKDFVPVYKACGGEEVEAVDYILATKVFRKFESLNLGLIRDEIKGLINQLDATFGKDKMVECIAYLRRLQKSF